MQATGRSATVAPGGQAQSEDGSSGGRGMPLGCNKERGGGPAGTGRNHRGRIPALRQQWQEQDKEVWVPDKLPRQGHEPAK